MRSKWEYKCLRVYDTSGPVSEPGQSFQHEREQLAASGFDLCDNADGLVAKLTDLGHHGWELVATDGGHTFFFKRPETAHLG